MSWSGRRSGFAFLIVLASGCGRDDEDADVGEDAGGAGGAGGTRSCRAPTAIEVDDVTGRWAEAETLQRHTDSSEVSWKRVGIFDVAPAMGPNLNVSVEWCDAWVEDAGAATRVVMPAAYVGALQRFTRPATHAQDSDGIWRFLSVRTHEVLGATLAAPTDELPSDASDSRVNDADGDGEPGATVTVSGAIEGELHVVSRRWTAFDGVPVAADRIEGRVRFAIDESLLGSIPAGLEAPSVEDDPDHCDSAFRMTRIAPDTDCSAVLGDLEALLGVTRP